MSSSIELSIFANIKLHGSYRSFNGSCNDIMDMLFFSYYRNESITCLYTPKLVWPVTIKNNLIYYKTHGVVIKDDYVLPNIFKQFKIDKSNNLWINSKSPYNWIYVDIERPIDYICGFFYRSAND